MDVKTIAGKTVFFAVMVIFIAGFSAAFGQENSLVGVVIVVMALMLLQRDLSARPLVNLGGILGLNLAMGLCAYVSLMDEYLGLVLNLALVFAVVFLTLQVLASPMHFPFMLGYAFMLAVPVTAEQLPVRLLALAVGSVLVVGMNWVVNRRRFEMTSHRGMEALCRAVASAARDVASGGHPDASAFDASCKSLGAALGDRLKSNFFTTPADRSLLDLMVAARGLGRRACSSEADPKLLEGVASLMDVLADHEAGRASLEDFRAAYADLRSSNRGADPLMMSAVAAVDDALSRLSGASASFSGGRPPVRALGVRLREDLRIDSVRFTFAVRMTLLFAMWAFVWQHWDLENAKWLLFTTVAIVQPYVDGSMQKSVRRVAGTLVGAVAFMALAALTGSDVALMSAALMLINYVYTVLDPKRYDVQMVFITVSALIAASMAVPTDTAVAERVLYILAGVAVATLANFVILPYRLGEETLDLAARHLALAREHVSCLMSSLRGSPDDEAEANCVVKSAAVSRKIAMNAEREPSPELEALADSLDDLAARCAAAYRSARDAGPEAREAAVRLLEGSAPQDGRELSPADSDFLDGVAGVVDSYHASRDRFADLAVAGRVRSDPPAVPCSAEGLHRSNEL